MRGVAVDKDQAKVVVSNIADKPGTAAKVFRALAEANINVDMIVQNTSTDGNTDISFTVPKADMKVAEEIVSRVATEIWISPGMPVDSIRLATLTVSPQRSKENLFRPITPPTTGPE